MKKQSIQSLVQQSMKLAQVATPILLFSLILSGVDAIPTPLNIPGLSLVLMIFHLVLFFIATGLTLSTPALLEYVEKHKKISFGYIFSQVKQYARKSAPGVFALYAGGTIIFTIFLFSLSMVLSSVFKMGNMMETVRDMTSVFWGMVLFRVIFSIGSALLSTTPIFYSLKKQGLLSSLSQSIRYGLAHRELVGMIFIIWFVGGVVVDGIGTVMPSILVLLRFVEGAIIGYLVACIVYRYYKHNT